MIGVLKHCLGATGIYLPLLAAGLALLELIWLAVRHLGSGTLRPGDFRVMACLTVFGSTAVMLFLKGGIRVSPLHMLLGIVPALVVFAVLVDLWCRPENAMRLASPVLPLFLPFPPAGVATA